MKYDVVSMVTVYLVFVFFIPLIGIDAINKKSFLSVVVI